MRSLHLLPGQRRGSNAFYDFQLDEASKSPPSGPGSVSKNSTGIRTLCRYNFKSRISEFFGHQINDLITAMVANNCFSFSIEQNAFVANVGTDLSV